MQLYLNTLRVLVLHTPILKKCRLKLYMHSHSLLFSKSYYISKFQNDILDVAYPIHVLCI